jgi:hypothetical protein
VGLLPEDGQPCQVPGDDGGDTTVSIPVSECLVLPLLRPVVGSGRTPHRRIEESPLTVFMDVDIACRASWALPGQQVLARTRHPGPARPDALGCSMDLGDRWETQRRSHR